MAETADITITGLGPGPAKLWTEEARTAVTSDAPLWLRTRRHPASAEAAAIRPDARDFDFVYDEAAGLPAVYDRIAELLIEEAAAGPVVYAVPGSPSFGEESVRKVTTRARERGLATRTLAGVSFLEPLLSAIGWDAFDGVQVLDAMDMARRHYPSLDPDRPAVLAQAYSRLVASDVKLVLLATFPPDHQVAVVRGAGTPAESTRWLELVDLDRDGEFDDETTLAIPPLSCGADDSGGAPIGGSLTTMAEMMARLRAPDGCPWDLEQTHASLRPYLLEEAYETLSALDDDDPERLREELGDLLLQVVFHAQIASEEATFNLADVICGITRKIVARHPHVFGTETVEDAADVLSRWEELKRAERTARGFDHDSFAGIPTTLPALARAQQIQERAARIGLALISVPARANEDAAEAAARVLWEAVEAARAVGVDAEDALRAECGRRLELVRSATAHGSKEGDGIR